MSGSACLVGGIDVSSVCRLCLSTERVMSSIEDVRWAYHILTDTYEEVSWASHLCWECGALLRRIGALQQQALRAAATLKTAQVHIEGTSALAGLCLSRLGTTTRCHPDFELVSPTCDRTDLKEPTSPQEPCAAELVRVKSDGDIVVPKAEPWDADECDVWAEAAPAEEFKVEVLHADPGPLLRVKKKKKDRRKIDVGKEKERVKRETREARATLENTEVGLKRERRKACVSKEKREPRVKREPLTDAELLEDLEGACELAWESAADVRRKRAARARTDAFAARRHKCEACALCFPSERARAAHARRLHCEGPEAVACDICGCRAADAALAAEHRATHRALSCRRCRFATRSVRNMRRHATVHARSPSRQFSCDVCGKQFTNKQHFYVHRKTHTSRQTYECEHCGRVYRTRTQMFRHLRSHRKRFLCDICGKMFSAQTYLKCHYLAHSGAAERRFECARCHRRYINKFKLEVHMRFHTGEKPFRCDACGDRSFREKAQLTAHNRRYHQVETVNVVKKKKKFERTKSAFVNERFVASKESAPDNGDKTIDPETKTNRARTDRGPKTKIEKVEYVCNFCGKKFNDKWRLKFHLGVHSDERPYKCDECDLTFKYQSGLWTHKLLHRGEKPHQCTICGSQFTQKGNLTAHLKIHTDEKPFECSVCGNKFRMRRNLRNHMKVHMNIDGCKILALCE